MRLLSLQVENRLASTTSTESTQLGNYKCKWWEGMDEACVVLTISITFLLAK
jgi:hypothetical protein